MKKKKIRESFEPTTSERAMRAIANMTHRDLQRECILRGIEFESVHKLGHPKMVSWLMDHFDDGQDLSNLTLFDVWNEGKLLELGYKPGDALLHPNLRLGYTHTESINGKEPKPEKKREDKPKKEPVGKDESTGIKKGTKKNLTYTLQREGLELSEVTKRVKAEFPEADEGSIKIWFHRSKKQQSIENA